MKFMKKPLIYLMCALLSMTALSACNNKEEQEKNAEQQNTTGGIAGSEETQATTEDKNKLDDLGEFNFSGYEFVIYNRVNDGWANSRLDFEELTGEVYQDEVYIRNRNIEDRFNVTINMIEYTDQGKIKSMLLSGTNDYDLYTGRNAEVFAYAQEGLISSINDLPHINLSKDYWDEFLTNQMSVVGKKYFAVGSFNFSNLDMSYVLVFNKQLFKDYGLENPFELVKNGDWTYDKFAEMCRTGTFDLNGDGAVGANDAWGYVARSNDVLPCFWISAGVVAAQKDNDDVPQNNMGSEKFINVIDRIFDVTYRNETYYNSDAQTMFLGGNVLFNDITPYNLQKLRSLETDFGILPYPKLDKAQEEYYTRIGGCELFFAAKSASKEDLERTSVILEAMACESLKTCVPAYYDLMLKTKLARDVESEEIIDLVFAHRVFDFVDNLWVAEIRDGPLNTMFTSKNNTIVSLNESRLNTLFNSKRDKMVDAFSSLGE